MNLDKKTVHSKGTYVLILQLQKNTKLQIGKLGCFKFMSGYYAYVGSAFGPGGLTARLKHHYTLSANPHWHIDYLRKTALVVEAWVCAGRTRYEHEWAKNVYRLEYSSCPIKRFGSSDCGCPAHLFYFKRKPSPRILAQALPGAVIESGL